MVLLLYTNPADINTYIAGIQTWPFATQNNLNQPELGLTAGQLVSASVSAKFFSFHMSVFLLLKLWTADIIDMKQWIPNLRPMPN